MKFFIAVLLCILGYGVAIQFQLTHVAQSFLIIGIICGSATIVCLLCAGGECAGDYYDDD